MMQSAISPLSFFFLLAEEKGGEDIMILHFTGKRFVYLLPLPIIALHLLLSSRSFLAFVPLHMPYQSKRAIKTAQTHYEITILVIAVECKIKLQGNAVGSDCCISYSQI